MGDHYLALGLSGIKKDEFTHAKFLHDYLCRSKMANMKEFTDTLPKWHEVEEMIMGRW